MLLTSLLASAIAVAQTEPIVIKLWPNGAPGSEARMNEPEEAKDWWVKNIHNPSITVFLPPKDRATGAAILIAPGGGHSQLVFGEEGTKPAKYLAEHGIAAIALKYRLAREPGSTYNLSDVCAADGYRAMRTIRAHAAEWGIDPKRVGALGFSAGGELVSRIAYDNANGKADAADPIERENGKPDFQMLIYSGHLFAPSVVPPNAPPMFMLIAQDDDGHMNVHMNLMHAYKMAHVPFEAHFLQQGGHGFNMGSRSKLASVNTWPQRMIDWITDSGLLQPRVEPVKK